MIHNQPWLFNEASIKAQKDRVQKLWGWWDLEVWGEGHALRARKLRVPSHMPAPRGSSPWAFLTSVFSQWAGGLVSGTFLLVLWAALANSSDLRTGVRDPLVYSQWVRSTGNSLVTSILGGGGSVHAVPRDWALSLWHLMVRLDRQGQNWTEVLDTEPKWRTSVKRQIQIKHHLPAGKGGVRKITSVMFTPKIYNQKLSGNIK